MGISSVLANLNLSLWISEKASGLFQLVALKYESDYVWGTVLTRARKFESEVSSLTGS